MHGPCVPSDHHDHDDTPLLYQSINMINQHRLCQIYNKYQNHILTSTSLHTVTVFAFLCVGDLKKATGQIYS